MNAIILFEPVRCPDCESVVDRWQVLADDPDTLVAVCHSCRALYLCRCGHLELVHRSAPAAAAPAPAAVGGA